MPLQLAWGKDCSFKLFRIVCTKILLPVVSLFEEMWVPKSKFRIVLVSLFLNGDGVVMEMVFYSKLLLLVNVSFIDFEKSCI